MKPKTRMMERTGLEVLPGRTPGVGDIEGLRECVPDGDSAQGSLRLKVMEVWESQEEGNDMKGPRWKRHEQWLLAGDGSQEGQGGLCASCSHPHVPVPHGAAGLHLHFGA